MRTDACTRWSGRLAVFLFCALFSSVLCAQSAAPAHDVDASAGKPHDDSFVIGNDDVLAINVWKEPDISRSIPVRSDGKISLASGRRSAGRRADALEAGKRYCQQAQELYLRARSYGDGAAGQQPEIQYSGPGGEARDRM
jgi:hypothetical protein